MAEEVRSTMKNSIVGIFAHPDDEAFGPSGTLAKLSKNHDVYLICVTDGNAGGNLENIRKNELLKSAKILGIKEVFFLNFKDGELNNNLYHKLAREIKKYLKKLRPETVITFEPRGISGHIDHVVVSLVTTFVFKKLHFIKKLLYFCIDEAQRNSEGDDYFIYFPPGYNLNNIDMTVDISEEWDQKVQAIHAHQSQAKDGDFILSMLSGLPKEECFLELKK